MEKQEWIDNYKRIIEDAYQFAPCKVGDTIENYGRRYYVQVVNFKSVSSLGVWFDIRAFKLKRDGNLSKNLTIIHSRSDILVLPKA